MDVTKEDLAVSSSPAKINFWQYFYICPCDDDHVMVVAMWLWWRSCDGDHVIHVEVVM